MNAKIFIKKDAVKSGDIKREIKMNRRTLSIKIHNMTFLVIKVKINILFLFTSEI